MMDNFTVVFRSGSDAHFYVVGDGNEVGRGGREGRQGWQRGREGREGGKAGRARIGLA